MFANGYRKLYHFHLAKCGGTSLNAWLDWHVPDARRWREPDAVYLIDGFRKHCRTAAAFLVCPVVYTHRPLIDRLPPETFTLTVLRDPVKRLISMVADWRREARQGNHPTDTVTARAVQDAARLPLRDFLRRMRESDVFRATFDNYQTRSLAGDVRPSALAAELYPIATHNLETRYDVVGLTEHLEGTRAAICAKLGLVPDSEGGGRRNVTGGRNVSEKEIETAAEEIEGLTRFDRDLYSLAEKLFAERHCNEISFSEADFEARHAASAVERLSPTLRNGDVFFSVRDTLLASGIWGRDGAGTENCHVWTGPSPRTVLYLPCPSGEPLTVKLWIRGYAAARLRNQLRFEIDDIPAPHKFARAPGGHAVAEVAEIPCQSTRPFLKLTVLVDETLTPGGAGLVNGDRRKRGVAFKGYGWSIGTAQGRTTPFTNLSAWKARFSISTLRRISARLRG